MTPSDFLGEIQNGAMVDMQASGILASLSIAQAILESGWGSSDLAAAPNYNLFGIKANGWSGPVVSMPTQEYIDGAWVTVYADFRVYTDWGQSVADHTSFLLSNSRYANLIGVMDAATACQMIYDDGYATDPNYPSTLMSLIDQYDLQMQDSGGGIYIYGFYVKDFQEGFLRGYMTGDRDR